MSFLAEEIARQPAAWRRAASLAMSVGLELPRPGERAVVVGCGTSWHVSESYALLRESLGAGETDFFTPSQLPAGRHYDRMVAVSRSGTTTEIVRLLEKNAHIPTVCITTHPDVPAARSARTAVVLDFADEQSVVQTLFATTCLALLRAHLGQPMDRLNSQAEAALAMADDLLPMAGHDQYTFLGQGWAHGIAREAALKLREAAQLWTEAYPTAEYRHGPISIAEPGRLVWILGDPVPGLIAEVAATGATVVHTGEDPMSDLVRIHRLALRLAESRGLDADRPRHLNRSVILADQIRAGLIKHL